METKNMKETMAKLNAIQKEKNMDQKKTKTKKQEPFICLGKSNASYIYYIRLSDDTIRLKPNEHSKLNLLNLAPDAWWSETLGDRWTPAKAAEYCFNLQGAKRYSPDQIRGLGFWKEDGVIFYNAGNKCFTVENNKIVETDNIRPSGIIYQRGEPLPHPANKPMNNDEGQLLIDYCEAYDWRGSGSALLLAGFLIQGVLAGYIETRAHIWLNAPAGTGKTILVTQIKKILGNLMLSFTGGTSEAGIRQKIGQGARIVFLDEMETANQDKSGKQKLEKIMSLVRRATDGETTIMGTLESNPVEFKARSAFMLLSVGHALLREADKSRFINLHILPNQGQESFKKRDNASNKLSRISPGKLITRLMLQASTMESNSHAICKVLSEKKSIIGRRAELLSMLLAGAYGLTHETEILQEDIVKYIGNIDMISISDILESDAERCLREILESRIQYNSETIGTLVNRLIQKIEDSTVNYGNAKEILQEIGISHYQPNQKNSLNMLFISSKNRQLANILQDTDWASSWGDVLRNYPSARYLGEKRLKGSKHKGIAIPLADIKPLLSYEFLDSPDTK